MNDSVLITGAGTGLGLETALHLAGHGFQVYAGVLDSAQREGALCAAERRRVTLHTLLLDVTDEASIMAGVGAMAAEAGGIYAVVHNAGISLRGYFEDLEDAEIRRVFEVNLFGAMALTRAVLPHMRAKRRGRLIFVSSVGARIASMARSAYCASKFALEGFAESLMQEVVPLGLRVSIVEPAIIKTERWTTNRGIAKRALDPYSPYYAWFRRQEQLADKLVQTSPTTPAEVAQAIELALTAARPRLRYMVGKRARLVAALRRYLPGELFERLYFGEAMRRVTKGQPPGKEPPQPVGRNQVSVETSSPARSLLSAVKVLGLRRIIQSNQIKRLGQETIRGFYTTRVLVTLINVGFFAELAEQRMLHPVSFASKHQLDLNLLNSLCDYLYELQIIDRDDEYYIFAPKGKIMLETLLGAFQLLYAYEDIFYDLEALLRREKQYGLDFSRRNAFVAEGSGEVGKLLAFPMMAHVLNRHRFDRVLDLGCGNGSFLIYLCEQDPHIVGYGIDISPDVTAAGQQNISKHGLESRVRLFTGDAFAIDRMAEQLRGIQVVTSIYVLHEFLTPSRDRLLMLLRNFRCSFPDVALVICEVIRHTPEQLREKPGSVMEIQLFHELSGQRLLSRAEWQGVFQEAGFTNIREDYMDFVRTAIYTVS